ncbi:MAG: multicopper oxidase domain-containing protein, partial [Planctomycetota bacterium]
ESSAVAHRDFELRKQTDECAGQVWLINGLGWHDITERPILDTVEVWSFINRSGQSHPMHMHLVFFQVLDRQAFEIDGDEIIPVGPVMPPDPGETGWKDTVQARPQQITRVIARFEDYAGLFSYHCHILEHEDHEMMRQFEVVACPADVNDDAQVDVSDLVAVILAWGVCPPGPESCPADITGDGTVDVTDLVEVILDWGACG